MNTTVIRNNLTLLATIHRTSIKQTQRFISRISGSRMVRRIIKEQKERMTEHESLKIDRLCHIFVIAIPEVSIRNNTLPCLKSQI